MNIYILFWVKSFLLTHPICPSFWIWKCKTKQGDGAIELLFIIVHSHLTPFQITIFVWHPWDRDDENDEGEVKSWGFDQFLAIKKPNQKLKLLVVAMVKALVAQCCCHHYSFIDVEKKGGKKGKREMEGLLWMVKPFSLL